MSKENKDGFIFEQVDPLRLGLRQYFENIAISMFEWKGLDEAIPKRYPERWLYQNGQCVYFMYKDEIPMVLPVATTNILKNVYGEPAEWRAVAIGDMSSKINHLVFNKENSVLIRNDMGYNASKAFVDYQIEQLINVELTTRMNVNANKFPFMFKGSQETALQHKNTFAELMECRPVFFKTKFADEEFEVLNTNTPLITPELTKLYQVYWNRILGYLGIDSVLNEKSERMLVDEISKNEEEKEFIRQARLEQRKRACEEIKELFGCDVTVKYKEVEILERNPMFGAFQNSNQNRDDRRDS